MILPSEVRSGSTPSRAWAPPRATRKPLMTSSKIRTAPCCVQSSRRRCRKRGRGKMRPMFPGYGSTITAAIEPGASRKACSMASGSLKGSTTVSAAVPSVTPAELGTPAVSAPDPAAIKNESAWPW